MRGEAACFRIDGGELVFAPAPDGAYVARLLYKIRRNGFVEDYETNTALSRYPHLYLHGTMAELSAHVRNADERDRYLSLFIAGLDAANAAELEDATGAATLQPQPAVAP